MVQIFFLFPKIYSFDTLFAALNHRPSLTSRSLFVLLLNSNCFECFTCALQTETSSRKRFRLVTKLQSLLWLP